MGLGKKRQDTRPAAPWVIKESGHPAHIAGEAREKGRDRRFLIWNRLGTGAADDAGKRLQQPAIPHCPSPLDRKPRSIKHLA